jgi:hypothetical protein
MKSKKQQGKNQKKPEVKPKNGFEKLVESRELAKQKKIAKSGNLTEAPKEIGSSLKRVVDSSDINKTLLRKRNKKSLFDLESDDENITNNFFVKEVDNLAEVADEDQPKPKLKANGMKSNKDAYQDVIKNSKLKKYEKTKTKEELEEDIRVIDKRFSGIQQKLQLGDPNEIRKSKFDTDSDYFKMVESFKGAQLLKPVVHKPQGENKQVKKETSDGEEPEYGLENSSEADSSDEDDGNNPEIEDFEEKEVDRRLKRMNLLNSEKKLSTFKRALEGLKTNTANDSNDSEEEIDFDSEDNDEEDDDEVDGEEFDNEDEDDDLEDDEDEDNQISEEEYVTNDKPLKNAKDIQNINKV